MEPPRGVTVDLDLIGERITFFFTVDMEVEAAEVFFCCFIVRVENLIYERYLKECSWALGLRMNRFVNESGAAECFYSPPN